MCEMTGPYTLSKYNVEQLKFKLQRRCYDLVSGRLNLKGILCSFINNKALFEVNLFKAL